MRILIVDDNSENIEMMTIMLNSKNHEVISAGNGKEALEKLRSEKFDLIISDILMPVMDGFQLCRECKKDHKLSNICFIFYTATYIDDKDEEFAFALGAQKFIRKPQEPVIFLKLIEEAIETSANVGNAPIQDKEQDEKEILKLYNERLITKLEKKNLDLENEIASHKETEKELIRAKEKAEESDKLKTAFLANISHEIRTPLNGIIGFSDLITDSDLSAEKRKQYSQVIRESGDQLLSIVNDIISIATIEAGHEEHQEKRCDINKLLELIKKQNSYKAETKTLSFIVSSALTDDEAIVLIDETKLLRILINLINNAIKFTDEGYINVTCRLDGNLIKFAVKDTGIGIPPEMHEKIFDRFFQIDYSDTRLYGGNGLGLSIVKSYVHFLNGEIRVDSNPGQGSTFYFTLPYTPVPKEVKPDEVSSKQKNKDLSGKVILIAEDDNTNYAYLEEILHDKKVKTIRAKNGKEAVDLCKTNPEIEMVFMDIRMPELNGYEATKQILKFRKDLPIVAQTAYTYFNDIQKAMEAGCTAYIEKPISPETIMNSIRKYL
ncbi:MAG: response regulator [Bacteroidales bacterium]|nr:response regulator [Bacteroidales bacterium]